MLRFLAVYAGSAWSSPPRGSLILAFIKAPTLDTSSNVPKWTLTWPLLGGALSSLITLQMTIKYTPSESLK